jgi:hypothetical protein
MTPSPDHHDLQRVISSPWSVGEPAEQDIVSCVKATSAETPRFGVEPPHSILAELHSQQSVKSKVGRTYREKRWASLGPGVVG